SQHAKGVTQHTRAVSRYADLLNRYAAWPSLLRQTVKRSKVAECRIGTSVTGRANTRIQRPIGCWFKHWRRSAPDWRSTWHAAPVVMLYSSLSRDGKSPPSMRQTLRSKSPAAEHRNEE